MPPEDFDIVSDLNSQGDVPAHGADAQHVNAEPVRAPNTPAAAPATTQEAAPAKPLSLRDQISSAIRGDQATPAASQQDGGPARNPDGTFAPKQAATDPNTQQQQTPAAAPATVAAPQGIDPQVFASLPAETQAHLARTMEEVSTHQQRFASLAPIEQLIGPRIDAWAMNGMAPAQAIHQLLALSDFAGRDPGGFIKYMAQTNGVNLEELVLGMEPSAPVDPAMKAVQDELAQLRAWRDGQTQQQQQVAHQQTVEGVNQFAQEKDAQGNLLRPYFAELGQAILPFVGMIRNANPNMSHADVLNQAYEQACWSTPSVRAKLQQAANQAAETERLRQQTERAAAARTASASVANGAPSSAPTAPENRNRTLRETIRDAMSA